MRKRKRKIKNNIDIFPLDGFDQNIVKRKYSLLIQKVLQNLLKIKTIPIKKGRSNYRNLFLMCGKVVLRKLNYRSILQAIHLDATQNKYSECNLAEKHYLEK